jgi:preprotein translocase subunit SecB
VPDFLAAGPRDILVPSIVFPEAREIVEDTMGTGSWV